MTMTMNTDSAWEKRIEELIDALTLDEKVAMCSGADRWHTKPVPRLGIPALRMTDGPHGTRTESIEPPTRTLPATCFPTASALAATWNTDLAQRVGVALGEETLGKGCQILLGPAVNIHRHPLGGRNFEYFSEDPHLTARLAVAWIKGLQSTGVGASVKHFACNSQEFERRTISSEVSERALREIYWPAFRAAVQESNSWTVMSSYNRINGVSAAHKKDMLTDVLKNEWGFRGVVVSDWDGVYDRVAAANAGCDVEMPGHPEHTRQFDEVMAAVRNGQVSPETVDDKVRRILRVLFRAGCFDKKAAALPATTDTPEHRKLAFEAACEAMTLLKNDGGLLPLDKQPIGSIAVIGPAAATPIIQGGGSARVSPYYAVSILEGLKTRVPPDVELVYQPGCTFDGSAPPMDMAMVQGLRAEYFTTPDLSGKPVLARTESAIHLDLASLPPTVAEADFSVRWSGDFVAPYKGTYTFSLTTVGRSALRFGRRMIVDDWALTTQPAFVPPLKPVVNKVSLVAGETYRFNLTYARNDEMTPFVHVGCDLPGVKGALPKALAAARAADAVIVCLGLPDRYESEGYDRPDMELTGDQVKLVRRAVAANRNCIVVLSNGSPVNMLPWVRDIPAVLEAWYSGQESGNAVAAVLFGDVNPSGKLPDTFPRRLEDTPGYLNYPGEGDQVRYGEGIFVGYRWFDMMGIKPLFPFGHGLSYTTFGYSKPVASLDDMSPADTVSITVKVTNTGQRAGQEVVQLYVRNVLSKVMRPPQELKGFTKVYLQPGETKEVSLPLKVDDLAYYDARRKAWVADEGYYFVYAGGSSQVTDNLEIFRLSETWTNAVSSHAPAPTFDANSRIGDLLGNEKARRVLRKHIEAARRLGSLRGDAGYTLNQAAYGLINRWSKPQVKEIEEDLKKI